MEILSDVDRYEMEIREEIEKERKLRMAAEERIAILEAKAKNKKCNMGFVEYNIQRNSFKNRCYVLVVVYV